MAKYSFEFKKKVVLEYLDGKGGALSLSYFPSMMSLTCSFIIEFCLMDRVE